MSSCKAAPKGLFACCWYLGDTGGRVNSCLQPLPHRTGAIRFVSCRSDRF
jgi:hypothetical protein